MLFLHQGNSIYAFSTTLAVMLAGMGLGSLLGAWFLPFCSDPLRLLARLQLGMGLAGAVALHLFIQVVNWEDKFVLAPLLLIGPIGLLSGVVFPVTACCYRCSPEVSGSGIARLYSWNTLGCILGALVGGFVLIPALGVSYSALAVAGLSMVLGVLLLVVHPEGFWRKTRLVEWAIAGGTCILLAIVGDAYFAVLQLQMQREVVVHLHSEQADCTTTAFSMRDGDRFTKQLWINGQGMTCLVPATKMMAHLPLWLAEDPKDLLVVCFGMGTTVRSATRHEGLQVWVVELVPSVLDCFGIYHADGPEILRQPNVHPIVDDGRNYLLMNSRQYDVITLDPAPPLHSAGTVNLYSREFFQLCRQRLRPGGVMCLWIQPASYYEIRMIIRTFMDVFDHVQAWSGPDEGIPGLLFIGSSQPVRNREAKIRAGFKDTRVCNDWLEWETPYDNPRKFMDLYLGDEEQLRGFVEGAPVISDDHPYTEFPLWRRELDPMQYYRLLNANVLRTYFFKHRTNE